MTDYEKLIEVLIEGTKTGAIEWTKGETSEFGTCWEQRTGVCRPAIILTANGSLHYGKSDCPGSGLSGEMDLIPLVQKQIEDRKRKVDAKNWSDLRDEVSRVVADHEEAGQIGNSPAARMRQSGKTEMQTDCLEWRTSIGLPSTFGKRTSVDDLITWLGCRKLGWSLDHTGNLIEARVWEWPNVVGRYRPDKAEPLSEMLWGAISTIRVPSPEEMPYCGRRFADAPDNTSKSNQVWP